MYVKPGDMQRWPHPVPYNVWYWERPITAGEAALALSSHELWLELAQGTHSSSWAVVLEDDAVLNATAFCTAVTEIHERMAPGTPWLIYLLTGALAVDAATARSAHLTGQSGLQKGVLARDPHKVGTGGWPFQTLAFSYGTVAYAMSTSLAKQLVTYNLPRCLMPVDEFLTYAYSPRRHPRREHFASHCWALNQMPAPAGQTVRVLRWRGATAPYFSDVVAHRPRAIDFGVRWVARIFGQRVRVLRRAALSPRHTTADGSSLENKERMYPDAAFWYPAVEAASGAPTGSSIILILKGEPGSLSEPIAAMTPQQGALCRLILGNAVSMKRDRGAVCGFFAPSLVFVRRWPRVRRPVVAASVTLSSRHACPSWHFKLGRFESSDKVHATRLVARPLLALFSLRQGLSLRSAAARFPWMGWRLEHLQTLQLHLPSLARLRRRRTASARAALSLKLFRPLSIPVHRRHHLRRQFRRLRPRRFPVATNILRMYGPVVAGGAMSAVVEVGMQPHQVLHVALRNVDVSPSTKGGGFRGQASRFGLVGRLPPQMWQHDDLVSQDQLFFGGDCCVRIGGKLLGISASLLPTMAEQGERSVRALHRFYALEGVFPFHVIALTPPFCLEHVGSIGLPAALHTRGSKADAALGDVTSLEPACEAVQFVRGLALPPATEGRTPEEPEFVILSVGVGDCEASVVRLGLASIWPLLHPIAGRPPSGPSWGVRAIPRLVHQVWISSDPSGPSKAMRKWASSWQEQHPTWSVRLWSAKAAREIVSEHYPWLLQTFDNFDMLVKKADLIRYLVLHRFGGVAVDLDLEALRPIDRLVSAGQGRKNVLIAEHDVEPGFLSIGFMASVPHHPLWWHLAHEVFRLWTANPKLYVVGATGNALLTRVAGHNSFRSEVLKVEKHLIFPLPYTHKRTKAAEDCQKSATWCRQRFPHAFTVHHAAHSWADEDAHREPDTLYAAVARRVDGGRQL